MGTDRSFYNLQKVQDNMDRGHIFLDSYPVQVHFLMIDKCNVKCIMCGGDYFRSQSGRRITLDKFKTMAANLKLENVRAVVLAGAGDPLLNQDLIPIVRFINHSYPQIAISITTNGLGLTEALARALIDCTVSQVNISINAATRPTYRRIMQIDGFETVCRNARTFDGLRKRAGKPVSLQFSAAINRLNIEEMPRLVELARETGADSINLFYTRFYPERLRHLNIENPADRLRNEDSLFYHQQLSDDQMEEAINLAGRYGIRFSHEPLFREQASPSVCTWALTQLMVGFDGEIYPCGGSEVHFREKVEKGIYDFGNALWGPVDVFWNSEAYRALRISARQGEIGLVPECRCCANVISPNDVRSHIMDWSEDAAEILPPPISALPLVSVIVPTYNRPDQLVSAVRSIQAQTYRKVEIIVINDNGLDVADRLGPLNTDNNITYIKHSRNSGLAAARNTGIRASRGKYLAYLDDDDLFYPNHLDTLVRFLEAGEHQVAYTDAYRVHQVKENGVYRVFKRDVPYSFDFDYDRILETNFVPVLCFVHARSCLDAVGLFDESLKRLEDWDLWIRMSRKFRFGHIPKITCEFSWRVDGTSMTSAQDQEFAVARSRIAAKYGQARVAAAAPPPSTAKPLPSLVSIVILTFNQLRYTKECVESIQKYTPEPHEIIFVDNGSRDGTLKWLKELVGKNPNYRLFENKTNYGFAKGCNQGIEVSRGEYLLLLNNDVVVTKGWLSGLLECLESDPGYGLVGPLTNNISGIQKVDQVPYTTLTEMEALAATFREKYRHRRIPARRIVGFCLLFRRRLVEKIGLFDERFGLGNFEDDDYCYRAALEGYTNVIAGDVFIHHHGSRSFIGNQIDPQAWLSGNKKLFEKKWSGIEASSLLGKKILALNAVDRARELQAQERFDQAVAVLVETSKLVPEAVEIYGCQAELFLEVHQYREAFDSLNSIPKTIHPSEQVLVMMGYALEGLDLVEEAEKYADHVLKMHPDSATSLNLKGLIAHKRGDWEAAERFFRAACEANPGYGEPFTNRGVMKWASGRKDEALELLEKGFALSPAVPDLGRRYYTAITNFEKFAEAEKLLRDAKNLHPGHKPIAFLLIDSLLKQADYEKAMQEIEQAMITFGIEDGILKAALEVRAKLGPKKPEARTANGPTLSLCLIARDDEQHLAQCLNSIQVIVDEMIVVDTGSKDRTKEIAVAFGARVFDFPWNNNFAEARNYSLEQASGEWILILDADEIIAPADGSKLRELISGQPFKRAYSFITRYYGNFSDLPKGGNNNGRKLEKAGAGSIPSQKVRLFPRRKGIGFFQPPHSSGEHSLMTRGFSILPGGIPIYHDGWHDTAKGKTRKPGLTSIVLRLTKDFEAGKKCLLAIQQHTPEPHEIIFMVPRSFPPARKWVKKLAREHQNYSLVEYSGPPNFSQEVNQGIQTSSGEFVLLLDSQVQVTEGWLTGLLECLQTSSLPGAVGPVTDRVSSPQSLGSGKFNRGVDLAEYAAVFRVRNRHRRLSQRKIAGLCMLFRYDLVEKIGPFDEGLRSGMFADEDFCLRAALDGFNNLMAGDVFVHYPVSAGFYCDPHNSKKVFDTKWRGISTTSDLGKKVVTLQTIEVAAGCYYQKQQIDQAISSLAAGVKYAPDDPRIYRFLALLLIDAGLFQDALEALQAMPEQAQQEAGSQELFGSCYEGLGRIEEAKAYADRLLAIDPSSAPALNLKGMLAYKQEERTAAEQFFRRASESDPGYGEPLTNLGVMQWADHKQEEALNLLERGFLLSPTTTDSVTLYYSAVASLAEFARAELIFREAKSLHPRNKRVFFLFIDLLLQQGKYHEAMQEVEEALLTFDIEDGLLPAALQIREKIGVQQLPAPPRQRGTLSLCLIVKDEEAHLAKCLMSVKDIADEMIVVDTGSTDKTKDIATAFGARVFDFTWTNDFSEARNFSLSKASGDWILVLDGDEVLSPVDHAALATIVHSKPGQPAAYSLTTRNYTNLVSAQGWTANDGCYTREETGTGWHPSTKVRLFSNDPRIRFRNPVHEVVEPSLLEAGISNKPCSIPVHHYGKMDAGKTAAKGEDYYLLGRKKLEETGGEAKAIQELAIQASELQRYGESVELWQKLIDLQPNNASAYFNMGFSHLKLKNYEEALRVSKKALELNPDLKEAVLNYANSELVIGDINRAITSLSNVLQRVPDYPPAIGLLAASLFVKGDREKALGHFKKLDKMGYDCVDYLYDLADMLASERRNQEAVQLLEAAIESNNTHQGTQSLLARCRAMIQNNEHQQIAQ